MVWGDSGSVRYSVRNWDGPVIGRGENIFISVPQPAHDQRRDQTQNRTGRDIARIVIAPRHLDSRNHRCNPQGGHGHVRQIARDDDGHRHRTRRVPRRKGRLVPAPAFASVAAIVLPLDHLDRAGAAKAVLDHPFDRIGQDMRRHHPQSGARGPEQEAGEPAASA